MTDKKQTKTKLSLPQNTTIKLFRKYISTQKAWFALLSLSIVSGIGIQLINPQIIRKFIDAALSPKIGSNLMQMALLFFALATLQQLLAIATTYIAQKIGWRATNALREDLVSNCLRLDLGFYKSIRQGEIIEVIEGDVNVLFNFFSKMAIVLVSNVILVVGVLTMYFREDYRIGIAQTLFVLLAFYLTSKIKQFSQSYWKANRKKSGDLFGYYGEVIQNTEDLKANGATKHVKDTCEKLLEEWLPIRIKAGISGWGMFMMSLFLQIASFGISLLLGTWLWKQGAISVGTIYLFYAYTTHLNRPVDAIQRQIQELQTVTVSMNRIEEFLNRESQIKESLHCMPYLKGANLCLKEVTFGYTADEPVLKDLSLILKPGKSIGVIGRTGSGKTTLARLLMRFYDNESGEIQLGGSTICDLSIKELRQKVAYVTQDVQLFSGTIRDNLTFFNAQITDEQLSGAIKQMGIEDWFSKFENGLDTLLSVNGSGLSAGEAQLIAFVRVFINNPEIIILDEVSSRLDPETERQLQKTIQKLLENRMGIIIAHKLWTLEQVDDILILEKGNTIEYGNRMALLADENSHFKKLMDVGIEGAIA